MKSNVMSATVVVLALATAACGSNEPAPEAANTAEASAVEPATTTPVEDAETAAAATDLAASSKPSSFAQCATCHVSEDGKASTLGPNLFGVTDRKAGTLEGFSYSQSMKDAGFTWDAAKLDAFITTPQKVVPGTRMAFGGVADSAKRKEIVDYLVSLK